MTREQSALRAVEVLDEIDAHERERKEYLEGWRHTLGVLRNDLRMCREGVDQMTIEEIDE